MKFEKIEVEGIIESNIKIFVFIALKYVRTIKGYDTEDLIQEQKLAVYKALKNYDGERNIGSYIYAVCENKMKALYGKQQRMKRCPKQISYLETSKYERMGLCLADTEPSVEDVYYVSEVKDEVNKVAKENLSRREFEVYELIIERGMSISEVSEKVGINEQSVSNALNRVRQKLRKKRDLILNDIWYNYRRKVWKLK